MSSKSGNNGSSSNTGSSGNSGSGYTVTSSGTNSQVSATVHLIWLIGRWQLWHGRVASWMLSLASDLDAVVDIYPPLRNVLLPVPGW